MAKPNFQFEKRQRELAKKRKQEEKRLRKQGKSRPQLPESADQPAGGPGETGNASGTT